MILLLFCFSVCLFLQFTPCLLVFHLCPSVHQLDSCSYSELVCWPSWLTLLYCCWPSAHPSLSQVRDTVRSSNLLSHNSNKNSLCFYDQLTYVFDFSSGGAVRGTQNIWRWAQFLRNEKVTKCLHDFKWVCQLTVMWNLSDDATGYGPIFEEEPIDVVYLEGSPDGRISMNCRARANPPASYRLSTLWKRFPTFS